MSKLAKIARSVRPRALAPSLGINPFLHHGLEDFFSQSPPFLFTRSPLFDTPMIHDNLHGRYSFLQSPGCEIRELDKNKYQIQMDLPGIKPSDMNIEFIGDTHVLRVYGSRKLTNKDDNKTVSVAHFENRFTVGENVNIDKITANLADGVLTLVVPKSEVEKTVVKIPITEGPVVEMEQEMLESGGANEEEHKEDEEQHKAA